MCHVVAGPWGQPDQRAPLPDSLVGTGAPQPTPGTLPLLGPDALPPGGPSTEGRSGIPIFPREAFPSQADGPQGLFRDMQVSPQGRRRREAEGPGNIHLSLRSG